MGIPVLVELTAVRANEARKVLAVSDAKVLRMPESKFYGQVQPLSKVPLILKGGFIPRTRFNQDYMFERKGKIFVA